MTLQAFRSNEDMPRRRGAWNGIRGKAYMRMGIVLGTVKGRDLSERLLPRQRGAIMELRGGAWYSSSNVRVSVPPRSGSNRHAGSNCGTEASIVVRSLFIALPIQVGVLPDSR
jgi:hypothetical protein